jgi:hypothetical protein
LFGYGIDDLGSVRDWLKEIKRTDIAEDDMEEVTALWREIDQEFLPKERKYE